MVNLILALNIITIFLLIIAGTVTVRFLYRDELLIVFDFLLFQMQLFPFRKNEKKDEPSSRRKLTSRYKNALATKRALDFLLKHSDIRIRTMKIRAQERDPAKLTVYNGYIDTFICALVAYLRVKATSLKNSDPPFSNPPLPDVENPTIDITLYTSLHVVAFTFLSYFKLKGKREVKIVGNKNE